MKHDFSTAPQKLFLVGAQSGAPSSQSIHQWGDIPPAIVGGRGTVDGGWSTGSEQEAEDVAIGLALHAVKGTPLPAVLVAKPLVKSLLTQPEPRSWKPRTGWAHAPAEHSRNYAAVYSEVSLAVQAALREWVPALYFSEADRFDDLELAYGMLAWRASRPAVGAHIDRLSYDVLDPKMMERCFYWIGRSMRRQLSLVLPVVQKLGGGRARKFQPSSDQRIIERVRRCQRGLFHLLKAEEEIVNQLLKLVSQLAEIRQTGKGVGVEKHVRRVMGNVEVQLRRMSSQADFAGVSMMLLVVVTATIERELEVVHLQKAA